MQDNSGRLTGSRASTEPVSRLGPSGFDPERGPYGAPVSTVAELDELESDGIVEGYFDGRRNEPEPTGNRSRSYWHGWRNGMADGKHMQIDAHMRQLACEIVEESRRAKK